MPKHYRKGPSTLKRVFLCPGSYHLSAGMSGKPSEYAERGTVLHELASEMLLGRHVHFPDLEAEVILTGYYDYCMSVANKDQLFCVEELLVSNGIEDFGGTADFVTRYCDEDGDSVLHVVDLKTGRGIVETAVDNKQLLGYLWLAREKFSRADIYRGTIWQPLTPGEPESTCDYNATDLAFFEEELVDKTSGDTYKGKFHAGETQCRWCPALAICPEVNKLALEAAREDFAEVVGSSDSDKWVKLMEAAPAIKKLLAEIPKRLLNHIVNGNEVEGWKAVTGISNRRWTEDDEKIKSKLARRRVGFKKSCTKELKSPTQMAKDGYGDAIEDLVERVETGPKLVRSSDKRPSIREADAADDFAGITVTNQHLPVVNEFIGES